MTDTPVTTDSPAASDAAASEPIEPVFAWAMFWVVAWLGTTLAGGVFGCGFAVVAGGLSEGLGMLIGGGIMISVMGAIFAGVAAVPILLTAAVLTWSLWLQRHRQLVAGMGGTVTGIVSTWFVFSTMLVLPVAIPASLAGVLGGLLTVAAIGRFTKKSPGGQWLEQNSRQRWQFSLASLLWHITVLGALFAVWVLVIDNYRGDPNAVAQPQQGAQELEAD